VASLSDRRRRRDSFRYFIARASERPWQCGSVTDFEEEMLPTALKVVRVENNASRVLRAPLALNAACARIR